VESNSERVLHAYIDEDTKSPVICSEEEAAAHRLSFRCRSVLLGELIELESEVELMLLYRFMGSSAREVFKVNKDEDIVESLKKDILERISGIETGYYFMLD